MTEEEKEIEHQTAIISSICPKLAEVRERKTIKCPECGATAIACGVAGYFCEVCDSSE